MIKVITDRNDELVNILVDVWEDSVKATHKFLSDQEIEHIKEYVPHALTHVANLVIYENEQGEPVGFMGIQDSKLEMLFIKDSCRGQGIGKQLIQFGFKEFDVQEVTVNEQNPNAHAFYEHCGFVVVSRSELG